MRQLAIKDESAAMQWRDQVERLNEETNQLLKDVGNALILVQQGADSDIVDDIVKWGNQIVAGADSVFRSMHELAVSVRNVLDAIRGVLDTGKTIVTNVVNGIGSLIK